VEIGLERICAYRHKKMPATRIDLEAKPWLVFSILEIQCPPSMVCNSYCGDNRLMSDVLQPLEIQAHFNLAVRSVNDTKKY